MEIDMTDTGSDTDKKYDGIHGMVPREKMSVGARRMRDFYEHKPGAPFYQTEFGYYSLDAWKEQGMPQDVPHDELFSFDPPGCMGMGELGWCEAEFVPRFEEKVIEDRGEYEVVQDFAGRHVLCFKGRRTGFMPEYIDHPVKDMATWEKNCKWRLNIETPERWSYLDERIKQAKDAAAEGRIITQGAIGGYMYLRSLIGPAELLYKFYDEPELIHDCMKTWLELADAVTAKHQEHVTFDELFLAEDICYNAGSLISPDMIREFLFPYYQQLIANIRSRQIDKSRHLYIQIDSDGHVHGIINLYSEIGMDYMSPFEVASGCDVVEIGSKYPDLLMRGGVDKRELAKGKDAIDRLVDRIFPVMQERGGYIPTCDHGVPAEVKYEDYLHYRRRCGEFGGEG
jgi:uroporphyrinogen decarboxylase